MAASNLQTTVTDKPREVTANSEGALARARQLMAGAVGVDSHIDTIQRVLVMGEDLANDTMQVTWTFRGYARVRWDRCVARRHSTP